MIRNQSLYPAELRDQSHFPLCGDRKSARDRQALFGTERSRAARCGTGATQFRAQRPFLMGEG